MSKLQLALDDYLEVRRAFGFKLEKLAQYLRSFIAFMDEQGASHITTELALSWARQPADGHPAYWASRLGMVRCFASWHRTTDPLTEIPPDGIIPHRYHRKPPYIYTDEEIESLVRTARDLPSRHGFRGCTYSTIFGLLAVTGMRVSEVVALDRRDVDINQGILTIRRTKFGKSRLAPLHCSTCDALRDYAEVRDRIVPVTISRGFFVSEFGSRITTCGTRYNFAVVSRQIGLRAPSDSRRHGHGPRLHDLRHRFAVRTLIEWYRAGLDVERELPKLAAYLGHVHFNDTYWYIQAVPELLLLATDRLVRRQEEVEP